MPGIWILSLYFDVSYNILKLKLFISLFFNVLIIFLSLNVPRIYNRIPIYSIAFHYVSIIVYFIFLSIIIDQSMAKDRKFWYVCLYMYIYINFNDTPCQVFEF